MRFYERVIGIPHRVFGGTALLVLGRLYGSACTFVTLYLLSSHLEATAFGRLTFYLALFLVLDSLTDLGTGQLVVQRTAQSDAELGSLLVSARVVRVWTGIAGVLLMGGGAFLAHERDALWILLASLYPITHALELSTVVFKQQIAWSRPVLVRILAASLSLGCVLGGLSLGWREPGRFVFAIACGSTVGNLLLHWVGRKALPRGSFAPYPYRALLAQALPMGMAGLCQQVYFYVDNLFLRVIHGSESLGPYNIAVRLMSYGIMVPVYAALAAMPWLAREHAAGRLGGAALRLAQPLVCLGASIAGVLWPWCEEILSIFGTNFVAAAPSLRWLLLATCTVYAGAALMTALVATGRSRSVLFAAGIGLLVNLGLNSLLVPRYSIEGAAIATLATEVAVALAAAVLLQLRGQDLLTTYRRWLWLLPPLLFFTFRGLSAHLPIQHWIISG